MLLSRRGTLLRNSRNLAARSAPRLREVSGWWRPKRRILIRQIDPTREVVLQFTEGVHSLQKEEPEAGDRGTEVGARHPGDTDADFSGL